MDVPDESFQVFEKPGIVCQAQSLMWDIELVKHLESLAHKFPLRGVLPREMIQEAVGCLAWNLSRRFSYPRGGSAKLGISMQVFLQNFPGSFPWRVSLKGFLQ